MKSSIFAASLAAFAVTYAGPVADVGLAPRAHQADTIGGADQPNAEPNAAAIPPGPPFMTISIHNALTAAISTAHVSDPTSPPLRGGNPPPGVIGAGATVSFQAPNGFIGNMAVGDTLHPLNLSCASLLEFNYVNQVADLDISYVDGFTNAITCSCNGMVVTGCNKNLFAQGNTCGAKFGQCCANPLRASTTATAATPFFHPCQHDAFTFPNDNRANSFGQCQGVPITCCVGTNCPFNPTPN